jgi:hypothetical protein
MVGSGKDALAIATRSQFFSQRIHTKWFNTPTVKKSRVGVLLVTMPCEGMAL